jgi:hypothetical protein
MPFFTIDASFGTEEGYKIMYSEEDLILEFGEKAYHRLGGYDKVIRINGIRLSATPYSHRSR